MLRVIMIIRGWSNPVAFSTER